MEEIIINWPADRPLPKPGDVIERPVRIPGIVTCERLIAGRPDHYPRQLVLSKESVHGQ